MPTLIKRDSIELQRVEPFYSVAYNTESNLTHVFQVYNLSKKVVVSGITNGISFEGI